MAGWTLAFQMGVKFDRILDGFDGPFEELKDEVPPPPAKVLDADGAVGFFLDTRHERLVPRGEPAAGGGRGGAPAARSRSPSNGTKYPAGHVLRHPQADDAGRCWRRSPPSSARRSSAARTRPARRRSRSKPVRVGLWDRYGGSMPSGWTRGSWSSSSSRSRSSTRRSWTRADLREKFDVLIFVDGAIPARGGGGSAGAAAATTAARRRRTRSTNSTCPPSTAAAAAASPRPKTVPQLQEVPGRRRHDPDHRQLDGLAEHLGLPVANHLVDEGRGRQGAAAGPRQVLRARLGAAGEGGPDAPARVGHGRRGGRDVLGQPDVPAAGASGERACSAWRGSTARRRCAAAGRGGRSTSTAASRSSRPRSARAGWCCSARRSSSAPSRTATFKFLFNAIVARGRDHSRAGVYTGTDGLR